MDPDIEKYLPIAVSLVGGGMAGAILTNSISTYRSRKQPIGFRIEVDHILHPRQEESTALTAKVTIQHQGLEHTFDNLFVARIQISNLGNKDYDEFQFGISLPQGNSIVYSEASGTDRHHIIEPSASVTPWNPAHELDFSCKPLNRGDTYSIKTFLVASPRTQPAPISISSRLPVNFIQMPTAGEIALKLGTAVLSLSGASIKMRLP